MACGQDGEELGVEIGVRQARGDQGGEDVAPLVEPRVAPAVGDLGLERRLGRAAAGLEARPGRAPAEVTPQPRDHGQRVGRRGDEVGDARADLRQSRTVLEAEDDAEDDLEGDAEQRLLERHRTRGPGRHLPRRDVGHGLPPTGQVLAVEGAREDAPAGHVAGAVEEHEHADVAEDAAQQRVALAGPQIVRARREDGADVGRIGQDDVGAHAGEAQREGVAVAPSAGPQERHGPRRPGQRLDRRGPGRSRGQRHAPRW